MPNGVGSFRRFVGELGRRRVFRTAALYVVAAVVVVEAAEALVVPLGLSLSVINLVTWATILGFPIAVGLAWTFDVTPAGIVRTPPDSEEDRARRRISARVAFRLTLTGAAAAAVGATTWVIMEPLIPRVADPGSVRVAAPLPRGDILVAPVATADAVDAELGGRVTLMLLQGLSGLPGLEPVDPRRAPEIHAAQGDAMAVARRLNVRRLLEPRLDPAPEGVLLTASLVDMESGMVEAEATAAGPASDVGLLVARVLGDLVEAATGRTGG